MSASIAQNVFALSPRSLYLFTQVFAPGSPFAFTWHRTLATEVVPQSPTASTSSGVPPLKTKRPPKPEISTAIILNRSPIITPTPSLFERAYYAYQARIRRALSNPFPSEFYFKPGSLLQTRFNIEERKRERVAFGPKFTTLSETDKEAIAAEKIAAQQLLEQEGESEQMMPRAHPSDISGDTKSLDRKGKRNIYLLLQAQEAGKEVWRFPQGNVEKGELLHQVRLWMMILVSTSIAEANLGQAAQRDLHSECGTHMDTWIVSRNPIGLHKPIQSEEDVRGVRQFIVFSYCCVLTYLSHRR